MVNVEPKSTKLNEVILERVEPNPPCTLRDQFYPPRTSPQSCSGFLSILKDVIFEFNLDYIGKLSKFTGFEDPYLFILEFEEFYSLVHMPSVSDDVVRMKFIKFGLKDGVKRWMHCL